MRIAVDMDGVLAEMVPAILKRYNGLRGANLQPSDVKSWHMEELLGMPKDSLEQWFGEPDWFERLDPYPGAVNGFNELLAKGHDIVIVTSLPNYAKNGFDGKRTWMAKYFPEFHVRNFIASSRKGLIKVDALIDDGSHNIQDFLDNGGRFPILMDRPWNDRWIFEGPRATHVRRVCSWMEACATIDHLQKVLNEEHGHSERGINP